MAYQGPNEKVTSSASCLLVVLSIIAALGSQQQLAYAGGKGCTEGVQLIRFEWPQRMRGRQLRQWVQQLSGLDAVHCQLTKSPGRLTYAVDGLLRARKLNVTRTESKHVFRSPLSTL
jgi:hypothetical protein